MKLRTSWKQIIGKYFGLAALMLLAVNAAGQSLENMGCGSLNNGFGPFDYTNAMHKRDNLQIVEVNHFDKSVFSLERGITGHSPLGDLDYTLRAFPNHHLALDAMARLHRRENTERMPGGRYTMTCWFARAAAFQPDDGNVKLLFGIHLFRTDELENAETELLEAIRLMPDSAEAHYNIGLLYVRMENFASAREQAEKAYSLGYPLPGLRDQLRKRNQWKVE
jgi:tetratricopeptide (TPR) repeat protein